MSRSDREAQKISRLIKAVMELRQALDDLDGWYGEDELKILAEIDSLLDQRAHGRALVYLRQDPPQISAR